MDMSSLFTHGAELLLLNGRGNGYPGARCVWRENADKAAFRLASRDAEITRSIAGSPVAFGRRRVVRPHRTSGSAAAQNMMGTGASAA